MSMSLRLLAAHGRAEHAFLEPSDYCTYLAQYCAGPGGQGDGYSRLMRHFKCEPSLVRSDWRRRRHKQQAIATLAQWLRDAVTREDVQGTTWVPVPPSKQYGDPDFDDRLARTLKLAFGAYDMDMRPLLYQVHSTLPDHRGPVRLSADELYGILRLDAPALLERPVRARIALFDDVLTTGKHFKCCERRLREALPGTPILGVFLLRRALPGRWRSLPLTYVRQRTDVVAACGECHALSRRNPP